MAIGALLGTIANHGAGTAAAGVGAAYGGNLIGAGLSQLGNYINSRRSVNQAKELYDYQTDYKKLMDKMIAAGINPGAAAQGLSGATPSMAVPSTPSSPDTSSLGLQAAQIGAIPSEVQGRLAEAEYKKSQAEETYQRMNFNPGLWSSQIVETWSRWKNNIEQSKYYSSLRGYYDELKTNLVRFRPWELAKLQKSLAVMDSEISKNYSIGRQADSHSFFIEQQSFEQMWRNQLLSAGVNPSMPIWENIKRICLLNPDKGRVFLENATDLVRMLDDKAKENLGENYKRNALIVGGLHYLNNRLGQHNTAKTARFRNLAVGVGSLIPLTGGLGSAGIPIAPYVNNWHVNDNSWRYWNEYE